MFLSVFLVLFIIYLLVLLLLLLYLPPLFQILSISTVIFHISFVLDDFFCFLVNGNGIRVETLSASSKACSMASAGRGLTSLDAAKILVRDVGAMEGTW